MRRTFARADAPGAHTGAVIGIGHFAAGFSGLIAGALAEHFGFASLGWYFAAASVGMLATMALTRDPRFRQSEEVVVQPARLAS